MRNMLAGLVLAALAGCSAGDQASAAPEKPDAAHRFLAALIDPPQKGPWHPRDECTSQPGAQAFREKLAAAVLARNADALAALADKDIVLDFGGGHGVAELKKRLAEPDRSLWSTLASLLPLGCAANPEGSLTMPWYFAQDIGVDEPYLGMIVRGIDVPVYAAPQAGAKPIAQLSWDAVEVQSDPAAFAKVRLRDGRTGYMEAAKLRAIVDYRLIADKRAGGWKLTAFVAGD